MDELPRVSDHAVLRYLERVHGVPVEEIRELLANSAAIATAHQAPFVVMGKVKLLIQNGTVVTVMRREWARTVRPRKRGGRE